ARWLPFPPFHGILRLLPRTPSSLSDRDLASPRAPNSKRLCGREKYPARRCYSHVKTPFGPTSAFKCAARVHLGAAEPVLAISRVFKKDDICLGTGFTSARYINGWLIYNGTNLLAGATANAQMRVHVGSLDDSGVQRCLWSYLRNTRSTGHRGFFYPDRFGRRRTKLLTHGARGGHRPRQAAATIEHGRADHHWLHADTKLVLLFDLLDRACRAHLPAQDT